MNDHEKMKSDTMNNDSIKNMYNKKDFFIPEQFGEFNIGKTRKLTVVKSISLPKRKNTMKQKSFNNLTFEYQPSLKSVRKYITT